MAILNSIVSLVNYPRLSQISEFNITAFDIQQKQLSDLLKKGQNTEYGELYDFKTIQNHQRFSQRVPVVDYDQIRPYVDRMQKGEKNLLWPGEIKWFAKSSGTTSAKSKFIPVSRESLEDCHFKGGKDVIALYNGVHNPNSQMLTGKCLTLGGSHQINKFNSNSFFGDLSAILIENSPFWSNFFKTPNSDIVLIEDWDEKLHKITAATINENVTSLAGVPSWFLILLKHILSVTGKKNLHEIWPNLELFIHGGINFTPYRQQYRQIMGKNINYLETYNASEGFFAIQDSPSRNDMLLMPDYGIYYEFLPLSEVGKPFPKSFNLSEVQLDTDYAVVITTNSGLWRYLIGDTVRFTSLYPHRIIITGRTKHFINAFGEELMVDNADKAMAAACQATGAVVTEYTAAPVYMSDDTKGHHQWIVEFATMPDSLQRFIETLDQALKDVNSDYEAKRFKNVTLDGPDVVVARPGLFFDWMKSRNKVGGQNKVPRLSNNREYVEQLLEINN